MQDITSQVSQIAGGNSPTSFTDDRSSKRSNITAYWSYCTVTAISTSVAITDIATTTEISATEIVMNVTSVATGGTR
jgi:hypothetical protein